MAIENTVQFKAINFAEKLEIGSEPELKIVNSIKAHHIAVVHDVCVDWSFWV